MPAIQFKDVSLRFIGADGTATVTLRNFSMSVARGEFAAIVGPTGCRKSTTLNIITGPLQATVGEVKLMGKLVNGIDPRIGFVFQADAVFPSRTVIDNVAAGPLFRGKRKKEVYALAEECIKRVGLEGCGGHYTLQLSGMRKRVALAQTFINSPEIMLMDEPFSALDMQARTLRRRDASTLAEAHVRPNKKAASIAAYPYHKGVGRPSSSAPLVRTRTFVIFEGAPVGLRLTGASSSA